MLTPEEVLTNEELGQIEMTCIRANESSGETGWKSSGWDSWAECIIEGYLDVDDKAYLKALPPETALRVVHMAQAFSEIAVSKADAAIARALKQADLEASRNAWQKYARDLEGVVLYVAHGLLNDPEHESECEMLKNALGEKPEGCK